MFIARAALRGPKQKTNGMIVWPWCKVVLGSHLYLPPLQMSLNPRYSDYKITVYKQNFTAQERKSNVNFSVQFFLLGQSGSYGGQTLTHLPWSDPKVASCAFKICDTNLLSDQMCSILTNPLFPSRHLETYLTPSEFSQGLNFSSI